MLRLKTLKYALPIVAFLAVSAISSTPASAHDWQPAWSNGDGVTLWYDKDNDKFAVTIEKDGKYGVYFDKAVIDAVFDKWDASNPDPNDPNNGKGTEKLDVEALIKAAKGVHWNVAVNPENSPLGGVINGNGGGKVPHWNPGGDESGSGPTPGDGKSATERYNEEQKAKLQHALEVAAREAGEAGMGMFDGSEGGSKSWGGLKPHGGIKTGDGKGKDGKDDGSKDASDYKDPYVPKGEDLGAKPEIVNPTPDGNKVGRTTVKLGNLGSGDTHGLGSGKSGNGKTGKGDAQGMTVGPKKGGGGDQGMALGPKTGGGGDQGGKTDKQNAGVMSPGLLEGGGGFAFNGPSAAGSVGGHGVTALRGGR